MEHLWKAYFAGEHPKVVGEVEQKLRFSSEFEAIHIAGLSLLQMGHAVPGAALLSASLVAAVNRGNMFWFTNAIAVAMQVGAYREGLDFARKGLMFYPNEVMLWMAVGDASMKLDDNATALDAYLNALQRDPQNVAAMMNAGHCLRFTGRTIEAIEYYQRVLDTGKDRAAALTNMSATMGELGRDQDAIKLLTEEALELPDAKLVLGMMQLKYGNYRDGWRNYRARRNAAAFQFVPEKFIKPIAETLEDCRGKHCLVTFEQGHGDGIQFGRYMLMLQAVASKVSAICHPPLARLLSQLAPDIKAVTDRPAAEPYDTEVLLMDLPEFFGTTVETIPAALPYYTVPPDLIAKHRLPETSLPRVGLVWAGTAAGRHDQRRTIRLETFAPVMFTAADKVQFVSLQHGEPAAQLHSCTFNVINPMREDFDFLDTAAIIQQLDLVITVDTAVAHLAGSLAVPTWMLNRYDGCWRWFTERTDSPWYPGVLRLFQQPERLNWRPPITEMVGAIQDFIAAHRPAPRSLSVDLCE